jgi:hypothetical protein
MVLKLPCSYLIFAACLAANVGGFAQSAAPASRPAQGETKLDVSLDMLSGSLDFYDSGVTLAFGFPLPYGWINNLQDEGWIWKDDSFLTVEFLQPVALTRIRVYSVCNFNCSRGARWATEHSNDGLLWLPSTNFQYSTDSGVGVDDLGSPLVGMGGWYSFAFNEDGTYDLFWRIRQVEVLNWHAPPSAEMEFYGIVEIPTNAAPLLIRQPGTQTVSEGQSVTFEAMAWGTPPLTYQWRYNNVPLNDGSRISGAATNRLVIGDVRAQDAGAYVVTVSNAYGSTNSVPVTITVALQPPEITAQPANQTVPSGSTVSLIITAAGSLPMTYQWNRNGVDLTDGGRVSGAKSATLSIAAARVEDAGIYFVVASNLFGSVTSLPVDVSVLFAPPTVTEQPQSQTVPLYSTVSLEVQATGSQPFTYQWQFNGVDLIDGAEISGARTRLLQITDLSLKDLGSYRVLMTNDFGSIRSAPADLATSSAVLFTAHRGAHLEVSWNSIGTGMILQHTTSLAKPQWQDVMTTAATNRVELPVTNGNEFFRLFRTVPVLAGPIVNPANGHIYYLLPEDTWTNSEAMAENLGGTLTIIDDQAENDWIYATFGYYGGLPRNLWIGCTDAAMEGTWVWVTGQPLTYSNWAASSGEPNNSGGGENCGQIFPPFEVAGRASLWNDIDCHAQINGVVEVIPRAGPWRARNRKKE